MVASWSCTVCIGVSKDGKTVFLEVPDLQPVMQMKVQYNIATDKGKKLSNAIYNTIHAFRPEIDPRTIGELTTAAR